MDVFDSSYPGGSGAVDALNEYMNMPQLHLALGVDQPGSSTSSAETAPEQPTDMTTSPEETEDTEIEETRRGMERVEHGEQGEGEEEIAVITWVDCGNGLEEVLAGMRFSSNSYPVWGVLNTMRSLVVETEWNLFGGPQGLELVRQCRKERFCVSVLTCGRH